MKKQILTAAIATLLAAGCFPDVGEGKAKATVNEPAAQAAPEPAPEAEPTATTRTVDIDASKSKIAAVGAKVTGKHDIAFDKWSGSVDVVNNELRGVKVEIAMSSLRADVDKLTGHLKSADFFEVEKFPTSTFESTKVTKAAGAGGTTHVIVGKLTMHGVTKEISFPAKIAVSAASVDAQAEFVINRKDFGIVYPGMPDDLIKDEVALTIQLVASNPGA